MAEIKMDSEFLNLEDKIRRIEKVHPNRIYEKYDELGHEIRKELRSATPEGKSGKLKKRWVTERTQKEYGTYVKKIRNTAPHFHLVERGHRLVLGGKVVGSVKGKYFTEAKLAELAPQINREHEKLIDGIMEEVFGDWQ